MYVDGFVIPVPLANKDAYRRIAETFAAVAKEYGLVSVMECWADDVPRGKVTDFYRAVQCGDDETVVFSWMIWPDKQTRDTAGPKIEADPRLADMQASAVFDGKRLIYGGFTPLFSA